MTLQQEAPAAIGNGPLHAEVHGFYARQMQDLDAGAVDAWATTFTEDGVFAANAHPHPFVGRDAIAAGARAAHAALAERGAQRRHWLGMLSVTGDDDGSLRARSYALILETVAGGRTEVLMSTTCDDVLVPDGDGWLVRERRVRRDDLPDA